MHYGKPLQCIMGSPCKALWEASQIAFTPQALQGFSNLRTEIKLEEDHEFPEIGFASFREE